MKKEIKHVHFSENDIWVYQVLRHGTSFNIYSPAKKLYRLDYITICKFNTQ